MTVDRPQPVWTLSTAISASRVLLPIPLWYFLSLQTASGRLWAGAVILVAMATDFLDGYLARRWHQVSEIGKLVDPIADKIAVGAVAIYLVVLGTLPLWYVLFVVLRDVLILAGGFLIRKKKKIIPQSNMLGKVAVGLVASVLLLATVQIDVLTPLEELLLWSSVAVMLLSLVWYAGRLFVGPRQGGGGAGNGV